MNPGVTVTSQRSTRVEPPLGPDDLNRVIDMMMADALGLEGEERAAVISYIEGQRAAAGSDE